MTVILRVDASCRSLPGFRYLSRRYYLGGHNDAAKKQKKPRFMGRELPRRSCRKSWRDFDPPSPGCLNSAVEHSKMTCASDAFARYTIRVIEEGLSCAIAHPLHGTIPQQAAKAARYCRASANKTRLRHRHAQRQCLQHRANRPNFFTLAINSTSET